MRQESAGVQRVSYYIAQMTGIAGGRCGIAIVQPFSVFIADQPARQKQPRQHAIAVGRIGNSRKVQAGHGIGKPQSALLVSRHGQPAAAIDAFGRDFVAVPHVLGGAVDGQLTHIAGDVTHVIASDHVMRVADASGGHIIGGQQQAGGFKSAHGQHGGPGRH